MLDLFKNTTIITSTKNARGERMPLINDSVYFVHIPRTGGRYVKEIFKKNNYNLKYDIHKQRYLADNKFIEIPHLSYPFYMNFTKDKSKIFTVVRNPVDRFLSSIKIEEVNVEKMFYDEENFVSSVHKIATNNVGNWFLPQSHFLFYGIHIWKYEDGFKDKFFNWLNEKFDFNFKNTNIDYDIIYRYDPEKNFNLTDAQIKYIEKYYYQDFKLLNYETNY